MQKIYKNRRKKLIVEARSEGLDKSIIFSPLSIYYFTGVKIAPYERMLALFIDNKTGKSSLFLPSLNQGSVKDPLIEEISYQDNENPMTYLLERFLASYTIGVDMEYLTLSTANALFNDIENGEKIHALKVKDLSNTILRLRMCKDEEEVLKIEQASAYAKNIYAHIKEAMYIGISEKEIALEIVKKMWLSPGVISDGIVVQVLCGHNASNPHGYSGDYRVRKGDPITIDFGVNYQHYWSDTTRTFFMGKPDQKFEEIYNVVLEAQFAAIKSIKPGALICETDLAARKVITKAGYGEYFIHRTGHGLGIDIHELPNVHKQNTECFQEGQVITIEPGIYMPNFGGVRIEDDVVVTKQGCQILNPYPKTFEDMIL